MLYRKANADDLTEIATLEQGCFEHSWPAQEFYSTFGREEYEYFVAVEEETIVGYACYTRSFEDADLLKIAIKKENRRNHVADELLEYNFTELKKQMIEKIHLEVRASNYGAYHLYQKNGFVQIGIRKAYYQKPVEDGIIMYKCL